MHPTLRTSRVFAQSTVFLSKPRESHTTQAQQSTWNPPLSSLCRSQAACLSKNRVPPKPPVSCSSPQLPQVLSISTQHMVGAEQMPASTVASLLLSSQFCESGNCQLKGHWATSTAQWSLPRHLGKSLVYCDSSVSCVSLSEPQQQRHEVKDLVSITIVPSWPSAVSVKPTF